MTEEVDMHAVAEAIVGHGDLDKAIGIVLRLPAGTPQRSSLAAALIGAALRTEPGQVAHVRHFDALLAAADQHPPPDPRWRQIRAHARVMAVMAAGAERRITDLDSAFAVLDECAPDVGGHPAASALIGSARTMLDFLQKSQRGDESGLRDMLAFAEGLDQLNIDHPAVSELGDLLAESSAVMKAHQRGENAMPLFDALKQKTDRLPAGHPMRMAMDESMTMVAPLRTAFDDGSEHATAEQLAAIDDLINRPGASPAEQALYHIGAAGAIFVHEDADLDRLDVSVEHCRSAVALAASDDPQRVFYLISLVLGLVRRHELTRRPGDLDEAGRVIRQARDLAGGPQHPLWSMVNDILAMTMRHSGEPDFHKVALDGLRNNAWRVLLQSDVATAKIAARDVAGDAIDVARQCLFEGDPAAAIRALDSGRGLLLHSVTEFRDVGRRLRDAEQSDLAERWERESASGEPGRLPAGLRRDVLTVLAEESGVLDPPSLGEIRDALRKLDADALVYLVPAGKSNPGGFAVTASVTGPPSYLALPNLVVHNDQDVDRFLGLITNRGLPPADGSDPHQAMRDLPADTTSADFRASLDTMCDWAWRAAIGPLVEGFLPTLGEPPPGRPHRIVLIPMGELGFIPWQAARDRAGAYAIERISLSHAVSARMLCRSAALPPVPVTPVGLVVGDPDPRDDESNAWNELKAARMEAYAIREAFYPGARYVGTRPNGTVSRVGAGTGEEIREWFGTDRPGAGTMAHLACHGVIEDGSEGASAYLVLAAGGRVTGDELLRLLLAAPQRMIGLVVLAACRTGRSIHGYDEAYSLGTALLAGGVRSVLSTLWASPDAATSVFMFMFHHYLMNDRLPAWAALRRAQLWMLDEHRTPPANMPRPLRAQLIGADVANIESWAGFLHIGQ